jgi:site-specific DNA recombinase
MQRDRLTALSERAKNDRRLAKVRKDINGLLTAIINGQLTAITVGMYHPSMKAKMDTLEAERARLEATLAASPEPEAPTLHPGLAGIYASKVSNLAEALNEEGTRAEAADLLRGLIEKVTLQPEPDAPHGHRIELFGELGALLSLCGNGIGTNAKTRTVGAGVMQISLVAGTGLHLGRTRIRRIRD